MFCVACGSVIFYLMVQSGPALYPIGGSLFLLAPLAKATLFQETRNASDEPAPFLGRQLRSYLPLLSKRLRSPAILPDCPSGPLDRSCFAPPLGPRLFEAHGNQKQKIKFTLGNLTDESVRGFLGLCRGPGRGSSPKDRDSRCVLFVWARAQARLNEEDRAPRPKRHAPNCSMQTRAVSGALKYPK